MKYRDLLKRIIARIMVEQLDDISIEKYDNNPHNVHVEFQIYQNGWGKSRNIDLNFGDFIEQQMIDSE